MLYLGVAAALALAAPTDLSVPTPPPAPIHGGAASAPGSWPAVVAISLGSFLCTGTLVSSNVVLTAAHCLSKKPNIDTILVRLGDDINGPGSAVKAIAYGFDPDFCADCDADIHDYGYIVLASSQPQAAPFPRVITRQEEWDELMFVDAPITLVGYGLDENENQGVKRQVEVPITEFSKTGLEFQAGGKGLDTCQGDSGGPAFAKLATGEYVIAGVTSRGYTCGKGGYYSVPMGGLCWLYDDSKLDLRPPGCDACDCLDTAPGESGCGCRSTTPDPAAALLLLIPLALRRRRR
ncbi:MAG: trypsin-like serine protease [Nannocystis sp.]|nr:trypsin-like serine protease [Nannocystis sp.]MBA3548360.1 trypsin-like serine protease [Nannocystis sp.]